jgi:hypothetical protein
MIVSASYKTDIPAFYACWFLKRLGAGWCESRNPYNGLTVRTALGPGAVDGFVFWTRNFAPLGQRAPEIQAVAPFTVQYTLTGYPRALEPHVIAAKAAVADMRRLAAEYGPRAVVWRYDPILLTSLTPAAWHRETFARLCAALQGATDEVVVSFAHIYRKTRRNLDRAAATHGFTWHDPGSQEKCDLLAALTDCAAAHGMALSVCAQRDVLVPGAALARCIDADRLSDVAGRDVAAKRRGNRPDCLCHAARDIGAYDSCAHGCRYCYAVGEHEKTGERMKALIATAADSAAIP